MQVYIGPYSTTDTNYKQLEKQVQYRLLPYSIVWAGWMGFTLQYLS